MMYNLYVHYPDNTLRIVQVDETGSYYDPSLVIWDERTQGTMPQEYIDADAAVVAANQAAKQAAIDAKVAAKQAAIDKLLALGLTQDQIDALLS